MNNKLQRMKQLIFELNQYRDAYYNKNESLISDSIYDTMFDALQMLENETGVVLSNSPTITVGYEVKSELEKVKHNHPMLSLDKTKSINDVSKFLGDKAGICMAKMDGLTCSLRYVDGELVSAETRGDGEIGECILHCAKTIKNIPLKIECKDEIIIDGEVIITYEDFEKINESLPEDKKYKNPRNLASGSIRQLDSSVAAQRNMKFIAWKLVNGWLNPHNKSFNKNSFFGRLMLLSYLGFDVVTCCETDKNSVGEAIEWVRQDCKDSGYPIDGCVIGYDDVSYGESLGATSHHMRSQIAFKFYDDVYETTLKYVEWTMGKTGALTPTAVFEPVEIDGTTVEKASVHNVTIFENLRLYPGDTITVYKANQIIPQIEENLSKSTNATTYKGGVFYDRFHGVKPPNECPVCGSYTVIKQDGVSRVLYCGNPNCKGKLLAKFNNFVSRKCMDINGLSEATLEVLINKGFVQTFKDLYHLSEHKNELMKLDGFGKRSVEKLLDAIENSRDVDVANFICALGIPMIGASQSKVLAQKMNYRWDNFIDAIANGFDFTSIDGFGNVLHNNINTWFDTMYLEDNIEELEDLMRFKQVLVQSNYSDEIYGRSFVITGSLNHFANRDELKAKIESLGGKVTGSVTAKTTALINNDINSTSSKNKKAKSLNVPIITEEDFLQMIGGENV